MDKGLNEYKKSLEETLSKSQDDFEKQISFICSGALGLSMFFIEKIVKDIQNSSSKWVLVSSWILFGGTLIINLYSHYFSGRVIYKDLADLNANTYDSEKSKQRSGIIDWLNKISMAALLIGIIFLIIYITINL